MGFWQFATGGGSGGGSGDVVGPASATDNAIARFDGTTGKLIQNSGVTVADGLTGSVVVGSTGATDNAILRADGTSGATLQASAVSIADTTGMITVPAAGGFEIASSNQAIVGGTSVVGTDVVKIKANQGGVSLQTQNVELNGYSGIEYLNNSGTVKVFSGFSNSSPHFRFNVLEGDLRFMMSGNSHLSVNNTPTVRLSATAQLVWSATTNDSTASADTGLARSAAGVVKVTDGSTGIRGLLGGGTSVASATALPVPTGRVFHVTGTTAITQITSTNFQAGAVITLIFDDVLTFTDGNNLKLAGDFTTSADDTITLAYDGTNWYECSRSVN